MKFKLTVFLATIVVSMGLLLGTSAAQDPLVIFEGNVAHGIQNLDVDGVLYNVAFKNNLATDIYGEDLQLFDFDTNAAALIAAKAARDALNTVPEVTRVGPPGGGEFIQFSIGFAEIPINLPGDLLPEFSVVAVREVTYVSEVEGDFWKEQEEEDVISLIQPESIADFTLVDPGPEPDPVTIGGTVTGLTGSVLVLQNNGGDDLSITENGDFNFATSLTPGTFYNVTVATNPTNPAQTCSVENGSGTVPDQDVTNVAVSCGEPPVGNVSKVAAEGETLPDPDSTILNKIFLEGGVAINSLGEVAFHGETSSTPAVFTQEGLVAKRDDPLPGDTTPDRIYDNGGVAINLLGEVAFHGRDNDGRLEAVFTQQDGLVAREGTALDDDITIPEEINASGKVAINLFGQVAFHGQIQVGGGIFDRETFRAVFTQDGLVAQEGDPLDDDITIVEEISQSGGVAINDFGQVAFHGEVVDPAPGGDTLAAVFTQERLVAQEGGTLEDGITIVEEISKSGGVAINLLGQVVFHGRVLKVASGADTVRAVFTQDGLVVQEGDILDDGTTLEEISENGGVAINDFGLVAFHGRTGGNEAVFTQYGLVAQEGDNLTDGITTLDEISNTGGVAINAFGEVAFHGKINGIDAVFMSGVSLPPSDGEDNLFTSITW